MNWQSKLGGVHTGDGSYGQGRYSIVSIRVRIRDILLAKVAPNIVVGVLSKVY
jgi:hypothetical protein